MRLGRIYFGAQAVAGAAWWIAVVMIPGVRDATLGELPPLVVAVFDIPLFVVTSGLVAAGLRAAVWVAVPWTLLVTVALGGYAFATERAGIGAALMVAASILSIGAGMLAWWGRIPMERMLVGPLGFRSARPRSRAARLAATLLQIVVFWGFFLGVMPAAIAFAERRWGLALHVPSAVMLAGVGLLIAASALGLWSGFAMASRGDGTPLPSVATTRLVVSGPYRFVRNPMVLAGIAQGVGVALALGSWAAVLYALAGVPVWDRLVRPLEEADLTAKFGDEYRAYQSRVRCWIPRFTGAVRTRA